jgi:hypothetical protein
MGFGNDLLFATSTNKMQSPRPICGWCSNSREQHNWGLSPNLLSLFGRRPCPTGPASLIRCPPQPTTGKHPCTWPPGALPDLSTRREFGEVCYFFRGPERAKGDKFGPRDLSARYMGPQENMKGHRVLIKDKVIGVRVRRDRDRRPWETE